MDYKSAIDYLFNGIPQFQAVGAGAYRPGLETALEFDRLAGYPSRHLRTIHVAGTNGKGSTASMIYSALREAGFSVGLYTSPHLKDFRERIVIDGRMIPQEEVTRFIERHMEFMQRRQVSFFEVTTAMAFDHFHRHRVDFAVIETGLGGRLDSTNIITPLLSIITNIDFDHMAILGDTLEKIASEKAGIIKRHVPVIIGERKDGTDGTFISRAAGLDAPLTFAEDIYSVDSGFNVTHKKTGERFHMDMVLSGDYQRRNLPTALCAADFLASSFGLDTGTLRKGIGKAVIKGRWQTLSSDPLTICDTGHNPAGIAYVAGQIRRIGAKKVYFVLGIVSDKDFEGISSLLPRDAYYIFTQASIPRAMPYTVLAELARSHGLEGETAATVPQALSRARQLAGTEDLIFIGGSTFTVAEII